MESIQILLLAASGALAGVLLLAGILHLLPRLGSPGRRLSERAGRAPLLDVVIFTLLAGPPVIAGVALGWLGLLGAMLGQIGAALVWMRLHELANRRALGGPRLVRTLNRTLGPFRNHAAVWWMSLAAPVFLVVRLAELIVYPGLVRLIGLPPYRSSEWVAVSRHKFDGLVGHDLLWCLYCDWMTGVWSLGSEMLRNIESLYCPIRFADAKRCANCALDFPDIERGWVDAGAGMGDVVRLVEEKYPESARTQDRSRGWFGHPVRLTVERAPVDGET